MQQETTLAEMYEAVNERVNYYDREARAAEEGSPRHIESRSMYNFFLGQWSVLHKMLNTTK